MPELADGLLKRGNRSNGPTVLGLPDIPGSKEWFEQASVRERFEAMYEQHARTNGQLPTPTLISVYAMYGLIWWFGYERLVRDPEQELFSDLNMRRFILYNVLHALLGLGATIGPLGFRFKIPIGPVLHFSTPGTLCCPVCPELVRCLNKVFFCGRAPAVRSHLAVLAYWALLASLVHALRSDDVRPTVALMLVNLIFDISILQAMRLEQYGYFVVCLLFQDWKHGCQCVQLALWLWAGISKIGPWWPYVICFITKDNILTPLIPKELLSKIYFKDYGTDFMQPSALVRVVAALGVLGELAFPISCCFPLGSQVNMVGVRGMALYHVFIASCLAFASVQEWNYFCVVMTFYLFGNVAFALPQTPLLIAFLAIVLVVVPVCGQIYPTLVPFLMAYRPYMGNWRFCCYLCKKSALPKHDKLVTWTDPWITKDVVWFYSWLGRWGEQSIRLIQTAGDYFLWSALLACPNYRPIVPMIEQLAKDNGWSTDDFVFQHSEPYQNQVFGWSLGTGFLAARECTREAFNEVCGFGEGEMYLIHFEPCSHAPCFGSSAPFKNQIQVRCFDVTKGPTQAAYHLTMPFEKLAEFKPAGMPFTNDFKTGNSIKGTFMSTYY